MLGLGEDGSELLVVLHLGLDEAFEEVHDVVVLVVDGELVLVVVGVGLLDVELLLLDLALVVEGLLLAPELLEHSPLVFQVLDPRDGPLLELYGGLLVHHPQDLLVLEHLLEDPVGRQTPLHRLVQVPAVLRPIRPLQLVHVGPHLEAIAAFRLPARPRRSPTRAPAGGSRRVSARTQSACYRTGSSCLAPACRTGTGSPNCPA